MPISYVGYETFGCTTTSSSPKCSSDAIIRDLDLRKPIYRKLAAYGHMGREDLGVKWENTDRVDALKAAVAAL